MPRARKSTLPALVGLAGIIVLGIAGAVPMDAASAHSPAPTPTRGPGRTAARPRAGAEARSWYLRLAPAPGDFVLAQIRFPLGDRRAVDRALSHIEPQGPFGSDYLAVAAPGARLSAGGSQAFVLLVNRPSALEDPASVKLRLSATGRLAHREVRRVENPFAKPPAPAVRRVLCDLATRGHALRISDLTPLRSVGAPLDASGAGAAVAQAYDVACGLPYETAFEQLVAGSAQPQPVPPQPTPTPPEPQPAPAAPAPTPPVGKIPGEGCVPAPGYACPAALDGRSSAAALDAGRRAPAGA